jgi:DNA-directed RNA polymerase subunit RPC12/RpoP
MNMNSSAAKRIIPGRAAELPARLPEWFVLCAGTILTLTGIAKVLGSFGTSQVLDLHDPIFDLPFRYLMPLVGIVELIVAFLCLFTNKRTLSLGLVAWLAVIFVVYRVTLWFMDWHHCYGFLIDPLNLSLRTTDALMSATSAFLLIGSITMLWLGRKATRSEARDDSADLIKISCFFCGGRIKFSAKNMGQKIACPHCRKTIVLQKPGSLKMSCPSCGEHIEFSSHGLGQKISCPHCADPVTLRLSI